MAVVQIFTGQFQPVQPFGTVVLASPTSIQVGSWQGALDWYSGSFTYDAAGTMLTGGVVTGYSGYVNGVSVIDVTGISLPALQVESLVRTGQAVLLLQTMMAGNDDVRPYSDSGHPVYDAVLHGYAGNDRMSGGGFGHDLLYGDEGNDTFFAVQDGDTADGGAGLDTVNFVFSRSHYGIAQLAGGAQVTGLDGLIAGDVATLVGVERLRFGGSECVALDIDGHGGQAYRLYQAAFDRVPDLSGLGFQINALDSGHSIVAVAGNFIASPEFQQTYGALDNSQFVTQLYANVLDRLPDAGGLAFHRASLEAGMSRAQVLVGFSESPENQAAVLGAIQDGIFYTL